MLHVLRALAAFRLHFVALRFLVTSSTVQFSTAFNGLSSAYKALRANKECWHRYRVKGHTRGEGADNESNTWLILSGWQLFNFEATRCPRASISRTRMTVEWH